MKDLRKRSKTQEMEERCDKLTYWLTVACLVLIASLFVLFILQFIVNVLMAISMGA